MEIKEIKDKEAWEGFLRGVEEKTFLQSWNWGEFNKMMGDKIWRLGIYESSEFGVRSSELKGVALAIKVVAKRGRFLFVPHGPIIKSQKSKLKSQNCKSKIKNLLEMLVDYLKNLAQRENCSFIRIAPIWLARRSFLDHRILDVVGSEGGERSEGNKKLFRDLGFRDAPIHIHPELTWQLDIRAPEQELLKQMRKTTRYLIKQGLNNPELKVVKSQNLKDIEVFNEIYQETTKRHRFVPFSLDYLKNEFLAFLTDRQISLFLAKYKGEAIAGAVIIFWQGLAFYHHGASSLQYPKVPASYLIQLEAIREAKSRGCWLYNFWGIADINAKFKMQNSKLQFKIQNFKKIKHPWAGLTLFKMGFGGYDRAYLKTQDLALTKRYWLNYFIEKLRRLKRNV